MIEVILVRHGESTFNAENRFTGWSDVPLSEKGRKEMISVGNFLKSRNISHIFTSDLARSVESGAIVAAMMASDERPIVHMENHFVLRGRNDGFLVGKDKAETAAMYGDAMAPRWRHDYDLRLPGGESLADVVARITPFVVGQLKSHLELGHSPLFVVHGNTVRALLVAIGLVTPEQTGDIWLRNSTAVILQFDQEARRYVHGFQILHIEAQGQSAQ